MIITWVIEKQITLQKDGLFWKEVPKSLFKKELAGKESIQDDEYMQLEQKICVSHVATLLSARAYTSGMLTSKLKGKGFESASIAHALKKFEEYGYLNDSKRICSFIEQKLSQGYGPMYIKAHMQKTLKLTFDEASAWVEKECSAVHERNALLVALRKVKTPSYPALARRGFSHELIQEALQH